MWEIGFGSGSNVGCYPDEVESVTAIEPSDTAWAMAADAVAASAVPITRGGLDGQRLPFDDDTFDAALSTYDVHHSRPPAALAELRRVEPGGQLRFLEHGRAPDGSVRRWQRRLEPVQIRLGGGCHLTRDIPALLAAAGWGVGRPRPALCGEDAQVFGALSIGTVRALDWSAVLRRVWAGCMSREFDIVVFGATGFVGELTARYLAQSAPDGTRIALAGRSEAKLSAVRDRLGERAAQWPLIVADSDKPSTLDGWSRTQVVLRP